MSRPGVSYQDIVSAAHELKGQGKNITIENIRAHLGTGSIGTINKYLRQWREMDKSTGQLASSEQLPETLVALIKGLWEGVLTQSTQRFEPIEANYNQEITDLKAELEKYRNNNQRWQTLFNQWQQEKTALASEKLTLDQALEFAHKENQSLHDKYDGLIKQLQEKQNRVEELHRLHQQTQANLEHYRESTKEQQQQLSADIKSKHEELVLQKSRYAELNQHYQLMKHANTELEKQHQQSMQSIEKLTAKIDHLKNETIELQQTSKHWQQQLNQTEKKLETRLVEFTSLQSDHKVINQKLADAKQLLQDALNQNKTLASEKWQLAQEKAQLEGQIQQMQKEPA